MKRRFTKTLLIIAMAITCVCGSSISVNASESIVSDATTYDEGQYKTGVDIEAGEYILFANSESGSKGYFCTSSDSNQDDIIENDNFAYNSIITIEDGQYLELKRCYAVAFDDVESLDVTGTGMFKVGTHLEAGEYKLIADEDSKGYYCIYEDSAEREIVANKNFENSVYVTVEDGQYLCINRCYIVDPIVPEIATTSVSIGEGVRYEDGIFTFDKYEVEELFNEIASDYNYTVKASTDIDTGINYGVYYNDKYVTIVLQIMNDADTKLATKITVSTPTDVDDEHRYYAIAVATMLTGNFETVEDAMTMWISVLEDSDNEIEKDGIRYTYTQERTDRWIIEPISD